MISALPPLPVAGALALAGLLLAAGNALPRRVPNLLALLGALAAAGVCAEMAHHAAADHAPLIHWFGGWAPRDGVAIGISFAVDAAGGGMAAFVALLVAAALVFAWGFYDEVHAHFYVLMLLFMAGMIGFCLTRDIFNLFVWFEVMSVAAFALTGYKLRGSALDGAINFTVLNTLGSYLMLCGVALSYALSGSLDFAVLARSVAASPRDPLVVAAFALIATGLLIKSAQVPFHFWLSDAHAVAPSPVSVLFSGAMVGVALFGLARLLWEVFAASPEIVAIARTLLVGMAGASVVVGGVMALLQRHIKRLLAFSTVSHLGVILMGVAILRPVGLAGALTYLLGHGLVKGALFMGAGILLARAGGIDEIDLRGRGGALWPAGLAMTVAALLLAGAPIGWMDSGASVLSQAFREAGDDRLPLLVAFGGATTGAAVLRVVGRVFLGLGRLSGAEKYAPTEREQERSDRPLWLMMAPLLVLLALDLTGAAWLRDWAVNAAAQIAGTTPHVATEASLLPWLSVACAVLLAAIQLNWAMLPAAFVVPLERTSRLVTIPLQTMHDARVGDYVAWAILGLALFAVAAALV